MTDLERLTLAIDLFERWTEDAPELEALCDAARAYRDLLANPAERVTTVRHMDASYGKHCIEVGDSGEYVVIPSAAVGGRLLVENP